MFSIFYVYVLLVLMNLAKKVSTFQRGIEPRSPANCHMTSENTDHYVTVLFGNTSVKFSVLGY